MNEAPPVSQVAEPGMAMSGDEEISDHMAAARRPASRRPPQSVAARCSSRASRTGSGYDLERTILLGEWASTRRPATRAHQCKMEGSFPNYFTINARPIRRPRRSTSAAVSRFSCAEALLAAGYPGGALAYYPGGLHDWQTLGLPVEPGSAEIEAEEV